MGDICYILISRYLPVTVAVAGSLTRCYWSISFRGSIIDHFRALPLPASVLLFTLSFCYLPFSSVTPHRQVLHYSGSLYLNYYSSTMDLLLYPKPYTVSKTIHSHEVGHCYFPPETLHCILRFCPAPPRTGVLHYPDQLLLVKIPPPRCPYPCWECSRSQPHRSSCDQGGLSPDYTLPVSTLALTP